MAKLLARICAAIFAADYYGADDARHHALLSVCEDARKRRCRRPRHMVGDYQLLCRLFTATGPLFFAAAAPRRRHAEPRFLHYTPPVARRRRRQSRAYLTCFIFTPRLLMAVRERRRRSTAAPTKCQSVRSCVRKSRCARQRVKRKIQSAAHSNTTRRCGNKMQGGRNAARCGKRCADTLFHIVTPSSLSSPLTHHRRAPLRLLFSHHDEMREYSIAHPTSPPNMLLKCHTPDIASHHHETTFSFSHAYHAD